MHSGTRARRTGPWIIALILVAGSPGMSTAQNLVPNAGFEEVIECPDWQSQLDRTEDWFDPSEQGTPDYYHACGADQYSVPDNTVGFQQAVDGEAYTGIFLWIYLLVDWREMIQVELKETLQAGQCYRFRMHANLGDFSQKTTDDLGVRFAAEAFDLPDPLPPPVEPHIALQAGTLLNKQDWTVLEGDHVASGDERFLMIGNYELDAQTTLVADTGGTGNFVYCFIDSVSLTPCGPALLVSDEFVEFEGTGPALFTDHLSVRWGERGRNVRFSVFDMNGREVAGGTSENSELATTHWPIGTYVLVTTTEEGVVQRRTVMKR